MPFEFVHIALADVQDANRRYTTFNPLDVFAEADEGADPTPKTGLIYGAKVESEVSLRTVDFPLATAQYDPSDDLSVDDVEEVVRNTGSLLTDGAMPSQLLSITWTRCDLVQTRILTIFAVPLPSKSFRKMSASPPGCPRTPRVPVIRKNSFRSVVTRGILAALNDAGYENGDATGMSEAIAKLLNSPR